MQKRVWREHHSIWGYGWRGVKLSILLVCLMFALCFIDVYQQAKLPAQALRSADAAVIGPTFGEGSVIGGGEENTNKLTSSSATPALN